MYCVYGRAGRVSARRVSMREFMRARGGKRRAGRIRKRVKGAARCAGSPTHISISHGSISLAGTRSPVYLHV